MCFVAPDVVAVWLLGAWLPAAVELEFLPGSPYLSSSAHPTSSSSSGKGGASKPGGSSSSSPITLVKHYTLERGGGLFEGAGWVMRTSKVVNTPHWSNADKDPTHAKPPSSSEGAQHQRKGRTICSLFHLFRPNAGKWVFNITGDDKDAQVRVLRQEGAIVLGGEGLLVGGCTSWGGVVAVFWQLARCRCLQRSGMQV
jgi:hypothetical protein